MQAEADEFREIPLDDEAAWRARLGAAMVQRTMRSLRPYVPGEPRGLAALEGVRAASDLLNELGRVHGVDRWTWDEFRRAVVDGGLAWWKPDSLVEDDGRTLRVTGPCPIRDLVRRDPRACEFCRVVQSTMARAALPGQVGHVRFERFGARGRAGCAAEFIRKPSAEVAP